jgi:hypothetical protein
MLPIGLKNAKNKQYQLFRESKSCNMQHEYENALILDSMIVLKLQIAPKILFILTQMSFSILDHRLKEVTQFTKSRIQVKF